MISVREDMDLLLIRSDEISHRPGRIQHRAAEWKPFKEYNHQDARFSPHCLTQLIVARLETISSALACLFLLIPPATLAR
jgi:hypothetical protein